MPVGRLCPFTRHFAKRNFSCRQESSASLPSRWLSAVSVSPPWPRPSQHGAAGSPAGEDPVVAVPLRGNQALRGTRTIASLPPQVQQMPPQMIFPARDRPDHQRQAGGGGRLQEQCAERPRSGRAAEAVEERIVQELYLTREVQKRIAERLQEAYNKFKQENPPQDEVKASHILVDPEDAAKAIIADQRRRRRLRQDRGREVFRQVGGPAGRRRLLHQGPDGRAFRQRRLRQPGEISQTRCRPSSAGTASRWSNAARARRRARKCCAFAAAPSR